MPYDRPTLTQRRDEVLQDIAASQILDTTTGSAVDATMLETSPLRVMGYQTAGATYGEDGYIDWLALQANPWTATGEAAVAWAALKGVTRKSATQALASAMFSGDPGTPGAPLPAGTPLSRADGAAYVTRTDAAIDATGSVVVAIEAVQPGAAGSLVATQALTMTLPIAGVRPTASVQANPVPGTDIEAFDLFKARYLAVYAAPPQGGDAEDYVEWALAVPGVTRAWVNPLGAGAGTVVVYTMWDAAESAHGGFPQGADGVATRETRDTRAAGDQLTVADALYPLRPTTALIYSVAPVPYPVPFVIITAALVPAAVQAAALTALDGAFLLRASPLATVLEISPFETAVSAVSGMPDFTLSNPNAAIAAPLGRLPVRGTVFWTVG